MTNNSSNSLLLVAAWPDYVDRPPIRQDELTATAAAMTAAVVVVVVGAAAVAAVVTATSTSLP